MEKSNDSKMVMVTRPSWLPWSKYQVSAYRTMVLWFTMSRGCIHYACHRTIYWSIVLTIHACDITRVNVTGIQDGIVFDYTMADDI